MEGLSKLGVGHYKFLEASMPLKTDIWYLQDEVIYVKE